MVSIALRSMMRGIASNGGVYFTTSGNFPLKYKWDICRLFPSNFTCDCEYDRSSYVKSQNWTKAFYTFSTSMRLSPVIPFSGIASRPEFESSSCSLPAAAAPRENNRSTASSVRPLVSMKTKYLYRSAGARVTKMSLAAYQGRRGR